MTSTQTHHALYGNVAILRGRCPECKANAFISDGEFQCCGLKTAEASATKLKRMSMHAGRKITPSKTLRDAALTRQSHRCFYCHFQFGDVVENKLTSKVRVLRVDMDHVEPYNWQRNQVPDNFVAACQICNGIKGAALYASPDDARAYVQHRRGKKGWPEKDEAGMEAFG